MYKLENKGDHVVITKTLKNVPLKTFDKLFNKTTHVMQFVNKVEFSKVIKEVMNSNEVVKGEFTKANGEYREFVGTIQGLGVSTHLMAIDLFKQAEGHSGVIQVNLATLNAITRIEEENIIEYRN